MFIYDLRDLPRIPRETFQCYYPQFDGSIHNWDGRGYFRDWAEYYSGERLERKPKRLPQSHRETWGLEL